MQGIPQIAAGSRDNCPGLLCMYASFFVPIKCSNRGLRGNSFMLITQWLTPRINNSLPPSFQLSSNFMKHSVRLVSAIRQSRPIVRPRPITTV